MNWADMFDGGTLMAVELAGIVLIFLACVCAAGVFLLGLYLTAKLSQALLRYAVRQIRSKGLNVEMSDLQTFRPGDVQTD